MFVPYSIENFYSNLDLAEKFHMWILPDDPRIIYGWEIPKYLDRGYIFVSKTRTGYKLHESLNNSDMRRLINRNGVIAINPNWEITPHKRVKINEITEDKKINFSDQLVLSIKLDGDMLNLCLTIYYPELDEVELSIPRNKSLDIKSLPYYSRLWVSMVLE